MDGSNMIVQDEAQHKAAGRGWFESPAPARAALEQLARSTPPSESLRLSDNPRLIDAVYKIRYDDARGPEQWEVIRDYMKNFPGAALKSTWAEKPISQIPHIDSWRQSLPAADQQNQPVSGGREETLSSAAAAGERIAEPGEGELKVAQVGAGTQRTRRMPSVAQKLENPGDFPTLDMDEVRQALNQPSRSTIYRWADEGKLERASLGKISGKRSKFLVKTESVKRMLEENAE